MNALERPGWIAATAALLALAAAGPAWAHAFGERYDLPVPLGLYLAGAGATVAFSFIVIGLFFRRTAWSRAYPRLNLLRFAPARLVAHPRFLGLIRLAAVLLFLLVLAAGFLGDQHPLRNIAPTMVWVVWWVGLAFVCAFIGNLWMLINPWRTLFAWGETLARRITGGRALGLDLPYPHALGVWPAVALLLGFSWLELVFPEPALPANIAWAALAYSLLTWAGMFVFGRERWLKQGEVFSLFFGLLARFAPMEIRVRTGRHCRACGLGCRDRDGNCINCTTCYGKVRASERKWVLRPHAVGLMRSEDISFSMVAFVLLALSSVIADGVLATPGWRAAENGFLALFAEPGMYHRLTARSLGLLGLWVLFLGAYMAIAALTAATTGGHLDTGAVARRFAFTLVPIAIAYHLAHYASFLLINGQYLIPLASDPFGHGWNLFGTAGYKVDIGLVGARFAWYFAVIAIVAGHVLAVLLAHVQAMAAVPAAPLGVRSEVPMTTLMVAFTVISLSVLAEPIVSRSPVASATQEPGTTAPVAVPADALLPEAGSGRFRPVGTGRTSQAALRYGAMTSLFHDGTRMNAADILYAYAFAYRWGTEGSGHYDADIGAATALLRERLAGLKPAGVDSTSKSFRAADIEFIREMQLVDIYLSAAPDDTVAAAPLAPPWSSLPWHAVALMEEAVTRGWAAFSESQARRRGVPWLDVVRDEAMNEKLKALVDEFAEKGFVPEPLAEMVGAPEARARWQALKAFYEKHKHFLVTNGPYWLESWSRNATVLKVFRNMSYPLGVGSFDAYAVPRRAYITGIEMRDDGLRVSAEIERIEKFARSHRIVRAPLAGRDELKRDTLECRYLVVAADGTVRRDARARLAENGVFEIDLGGKALPAGQYTVLVTLTLNGNTVSPDIRSVPFTVR